MKFNSAVCASCIVPVGRCRMRRAARAIGKDQNASSSGLNLRQRRRIVVNQ